MPVVDASNVTRFSENKPKRPLPVRMFNLISRQEVDFALKPEKLLDQAKRKTGLDDYGPDWFRDPFEKLMDSINREARLHPFARIMLRIRFLDILKSRLRCQHYFKKYPEITESALSPITWIVGLQRTGTTKLQRLLAANPDYRALLCWEALEVGPPVKLLQMKQDPRIARGKQKQRYAKYLSPEFFAIHSIEYDAPEEEVLLMDNAFMSTTYEAVLHIPTYASWLEKQDQTIAYEYLKQQLQLLQWLKKGKRWVLKTPHHLEFLPILNKVFDNVKYIQTHRDPLKSLPSLCSLVFHGRRMFSDHVDALEVGQHWSRKIYRMLENAIAFRKNHPEVPFLDISYYDLVDDAMGTVRTIYNYTGEELRPETERQLRGNLNKNKQHKYGKHVYTLKEYGLKSEEADQAFSSYRNAFNISYES